MTFKIPLFKVRMDESAVPIVGGVLASGTITQGPMVEHFERSLTSVLLPGADDRIVTVNSGTSALHLAYHLAGIHHRSRVIVTPMTCAATIAPLVHLGAEIYWADIELTTGNLDPRSVAEVMDIERRPIDAVVAVDWGGTPASYGPGGLPLGDTLRDVVPRHIPIIEDAAHAFGATRQDGTPIAKAAIDDNIYCCFSFQAIKHLTTGDGGALVCPTKPQTDRARLLRWFGLDRRSKTDFRAGQEIVEAGYKFHMNDIAAAIGCANLSTVESAIGRHRHNARRYFDTICEVDIYPRLIPMTWHPGSSWWIYTVLVEERDSFRRYLGERGIETSEVHRRNDQHPAFPNRSIVSLDALDSFSAAQVSIPCGWWLSDDDVDHVIDAIRSWAKA